MGGLVLFFFGSRSFLISHSLSVKLLVYGIFHPSYSFIKIPNGFYIALLMQPAKQAVASSGALSHSALRSIAFSIAPNSIAVDLTLVSDFPFLLLDFDFSLLSNLIAGWE